MGILYTPSHLLPRSASVRALLFFPSSVLEFATTIIWYTMPINQLRFDLFAFLFCPHNSLLFLFLALSSQLNIIMILFYLTFNIISLPCQNVQQYLLIFTQLLYLNQYIINFVNRLTSSVEKSYAENYYWKNINVKWLIVWPVAAIKTAYIQLYIIYRTLVWQYTMKKTLKEKNTLSQNINLTTTALRLFK